MGTAGNIFGDGTGTSDWWEYDKSRTQVGHVTYTIRLNYTCEAFISHDLVPMRTGRSYVRIISSTNHCDSSWTVNGPSLVNPTWPTINHQQPSTWFTESTIINNQLPFGKLTWKFEMAMCYCIGKPPMKGGISTQPGQFNRVSPWLININHHH